MPLHEGSIILITGPSGGGKTSILNALQEALRDQDWEWAWHCTAWAKTAIPIVDQLDPQLDRTISRLAALGLGDAWTLLRPPTELSDGQAYRFTIAKTCQYAEDLGVPCVILADEFCSTLDRPTAAAICQTIAREVARSRHTWIVATAHDDIINDLDPQILVHVPLGPTVEVLQR